MCENERVLYANIYRWVWWIYLRYNNYIWTRFFIARFVAFCHCHRNKQVKQITFQVNGTAQFSSRMHIWRSMECACVLNAYAPYTLLASCLPFLLSFSIPIQIDCHLCFHHWLYTHIILHILNYVLQFHISKLNKIVLLFNECTHAAWCVCERVNVCCVPLLNAQSVTLSVHLCLCIIPWQNCIRKMWKLETRECGTNDWMNEWVCELVCVSNAGCHAFEYNL